MNHDPLCTTVLHTEMSDAFCNCDVIARVREDEVRNDVLAAAHYGQDGYNCALRDAVEAVKAYYNDGLGHDFQTCTDRDHSCYLFADAVAAIEALGGER